MRVRNVCVTKHVVAAFEKKEDEEEKWPYIARCRVLLEFSEEENKDFWNHIFIAKRPDLLPRMIGGLSNKF